MIYCQLRARATVQGSKVTVGDVAQVTRGAQAMVCSVQSPGVWKVTALQVARAIRRAHPEEQVTMLGPDQCYVHREQPRRDRWRYLRWGLAFFVLTAGSALGLCWFHADVGMPEAQLAVYRLITGTEPPDARWITIPYAVGVVAGAALFYALPWQKTITPMEVRMEEFRADMEKTAARDVEDSDG
ncbi:MAG: hypothetical protein IKK21_09930 [Clostridia bacterium]|nr:hypothetical protein [Clostridia bacterium]